MLISVALTALTLFAFWPVRHHGFIRFDDDLYVYNNYLVKQGLTFEGFQWAFTTREFGNWHPLTWLSHMLDVELFGLNPGAHHLVNLLFHVTNTLLLFFLFRKMTGAVWRSAFVAALFAVHPLHVESVAWIAERKDVLSALFGFLSLWFYVGYVQSSKSKVEDSEKFWHSLYYYFALLFFVFSLMSKPMLVTLPFVLLLLDFWPLQRMSKVEGHWTLDFRLWTRLVLEKLPFFVPTIISSFVTYFAQKSSGTMATFVQLTLPERIGDAFIAYCGYLAKMFWPRDLAVLYPLQVLPLWKILGAVAIVLSISTWAVLCFKRRPYFLIGWLWFLGVLVPVIGLVHVGNQAMADRYTYLALIGLSFAIAWGACDLLRWPKLRVALAAIVIVLCFVTTRMQVAHWRNSETLFRHTLQSTRGNVPIQNNLAGELLAQGRLDEGIVLLREALAAKPNIADTLNNLGLALEQKGKPDEAIALYERSLQINPQYPVTQNKLGYLLLARGRLAEAMPRFEAALQLQPEFPEPYYNLGNLYFTQGKMSEAASYFRAALKLQPGYAQARNRLAETLLRVGEFAEAETHSRIAIQLQPDSASFQNVLGRTLAAQKKWTEAETVFTRAIGFQTDSAETHFNLANTFWAQGRSSEAKSHYFSALQLQREYPEAEMQLAMLFLREKNEGEAIAHLRNATVQRPKWREALNNLAWILATSSDVKLRNGTEALDLAKRVSEISTNDPGALDTLAAAQAEVRQFAEAALTAQKAVELAEKSGQKKLADEIRSRLQLYQSARPYREAVGEKN